MNKRIRFAIGLALLALADVSGCGKSSDSSGPAAGGAADTPDKPVATFLKALCDNDQDAMFAMLTAKGRDALRERGMSPGMNGGEEASYEVLEFEYVDEGAHVACNWIEKQPDGTSLTTPVIWIMHKESAGWRVAGMALRPFNDMRPIFFNFEDPVDMVKKQEMIDQEIARRDQSQPQQ